MRPQPPPGPPPPPSHQPTARNLQNSLQNVQKQNFFNQAQNRINHNQIHSRMPPPPPNGQNQYQNAQNQILQNMKNMKNISRGPLGARAPPPPPSFPQMNQMMMLGKRAPQEPLGGMRMINPIVKNVEKILDPDRNKFSLGDSKKKNLMEDYLEEATIYNCFFPFYSRNLDMNIAKETRMRIKDMKLNPQNYFNFGNF